LVLLVIVSAYKVKYIMYPGKTRYELT